MALTVLQSCKKRKRNPKMIGSQIFPDHGQDPPPPMNLSGPFRENIRLFLQDFGDPEDYTVSGNPVWSTLLVSHSNGVVFPLFIIEEAVKRSPNFLCDICRCVGWSNHFVSRRRYHMVIPKDEDWSKPLKKDVLNLHTHLLHGLVHCNGFGHLLRVNGIEEGSKYFRGEEIMDLWDRICSTLQTRKVTVDDVAKQRSMELRLLHSVAFGRSWFGRWGYKFCHGRFGVTEQKYNRAIEILNSLDLNRVISDFAGTERGRVVQKIVTTYRAMADTQLTTLSDLLQFMLDCSSRAPIQCKTASALASISLKQEPPSPVTTTHRRQRSLVQEKQSNSMQHSVHPDFTKVAPKLDSRYPIRRLEQAARVIVDVLSHHKATNPGANMCRQEVRDASRAHIGDTGLIDFTLKNIHNTVVGNRIVRRLTNPLTRVLEFSVESVNEEEDIETELETSTEESPERSDSTLPPAETEAEEALGPADVNEDVVYLYKKVLLGYTRSESVSWATRVVLDSNHFVKEWAPKDDGKIRLLCRFMPSYDELEKELTRPLPPGEVLVVPHCTTACELKAMAQSALRDTYCIMEEVVVRDVRVVGGGREAAEEEEEEEGETTCTVEAWSEMWVRGYGLDLGTKLRYEGGSENWTVDCGGCGARDDDGERMVACDGCHVWQHTRCNSIEDGRPAPHNFLCHRCSTTRLRKLGNSINKPSF